MYNAMLLQVELTEFFFRGKRTVMTISLHIFPKKLNGAQKNYSISQLECLAFYLSVKKFRMYIEGYVFTIISDIIGLLNIDVEPGSVRSPCSLVHETTGIYILYWTQERIPKCSSWCLIPGPCIRRIITNWPEFELAIKNKFWIRSSRSFISGFIA